MRRLGELWDKDVLLSCRAAASLGFVLASELRAHGVDFSFTPVLDIDWGHSSVIGDRAFHSDPRVVAMLASHLCHGLALAGMSSCGKHFPGHGWAEADSHVAIPHDTRSGSEILSQDAAPYRWLGPQLAAVMPAHVVYDAVDPAPAGFSRHWMDILRKDLGFVGAAFTDDLLMEGASTHGSLPERAAAGLAAGCDLVLVCNDTAAMDTVLERLAWRRTAQFDQRFARLRPRGPAYPMAELIRTELYRQALEDVRSLAPAA
jgi:beta-N-acetylhexosaminidase